MKEKLKNILNISPIFLLPIAVVVSVLIIVLIQGTLLSPEFLILLSFVILVALQIYLGSVVIKTVLTIGIVIYVTSLYTWITMNTFGYISQPFLLTLAAISVFLAQSYSSKFYNFGLRGKNLDSSVLAISLVALKLAIIMNGMGFWIAELIGLNYLIVYITMWRLLVNNYKKTKVIVPEIEKEEIIGNFRAIFIKNTLNTQDNVWRGKGFSNKSNAYPYLYSEAIKSSESGKYLVVISVVNNNEIYDIAEIEINKAKKIPYLYMESKSEKHTEAILKKFAEEIVLKKY